MVVAMEVPMEAGLSNGGSYNNAVTNGVGGSNGGGYNNGGTYGAGPSNGGSYNGGGYAVGPPPAAPLPAPAGPPSYSLNGELQCVRLQMMKPTPEHWRSKQVWRRALHCPGSDRVAISKADVLSAFDANSIYFDRRSSAKCPNKQLLHFQFICCPRPHLKENLASEQK
ncbi:hypothetical protein COOONC_22991 [Cooperia oncophora]